MSTKRMLSFAAGFALALIAFRTIPSSSAQTRPISVKLGTSAPKGTSLYQALLAMGEKWRKAPDGGADLLIFNTQGGEAATVSRMRANQLQAAMLSVTGLAEIDPSVTALEDLPFMFRSLDEVDYIRQKLTPEIEKKFLDKGYVVLFWGDVGWVRFFSKQPMMHPSELKKMKLFTRAGDPNQTDMMKAAGFDPVPLETDYILTSLQTGQISVVPAPPLLAEAGQFYTQAKHMLEINYAPLVGGAVITKRTWDLLPRATQAALRQAAQEAGDLIKDKSRAESDQSVEAMQKKNGLIVHRVTPEIEAEWREVARSIYPKIRGGIVPADMYDRVTKLLDDYRASKGPAK